MFARTSIEAAPWRVIPANDKRHARIDALRSIVHVLSDGIPLDPVLPDDNVLDAAGWVLNVEDDLIASPRDRTE